MLKKQHLAEIMLVSVLFLTGIFFRLWLINGNPQPLIYDQAEYEEYARRMLNAPWMLAAHSYRTYPYPLMVALIYSQAGFGNTDAVYFVQAVMDSATGVIVYLLLLMGLKHKSGALAALAIYTFNPITAGYVGVLLSEILSTFTIALTLLTGLWFLKKPGITSGLAFGMVAGLAAGTRNAAFIWAGIPIALTLLYTQWRKHLPAYAAITAGLLLSVIHPLITNFQRFGEINITTVDSFYAKEMFNGVVLKRLDPFTTVYPQETGIMFYEYYTEQNPGRTAEGRKAIADKYFRMAWQRIQADPWDYVRTRFFKMWYMWQKENIFFYYEPEYAWRRSWVYAGNLVGLIMCLFGIGLLWRKLRVSLAKWTYWSLLGSLVYATVVFSFSHAEYRITVPYYPVVIAFAGIGIASLLSRVKDMLPKKTK